MKRWLMGLVPTVVWLGGWLAWSHAQEEATYRGSKVCVLCHKTRNPDIVSSYLQSPHAKALLEASDEVIVADFSNAPFPKERVKYVLGIGHRYQAYLDENWKVLPGKWSVEEKKWLPQEEVDGKTQCIACHTTGFHPDTQEWKETNVGCEACHGPGSRHLLNPKDTTAIVNPKRLREQNPQRVAMICGQCHSRGHDPSGKFPFPVGFKPGEDLSKYFVDAKPREPGMNQQFSELAQSPKHWQQGVVCITCHEPHGHTDQPFMLRKPITELCLGCHKDTVKDIPTHTQDKGVQAPAGATCATCHMPNGQHLFDKSIVPKG
jgi:predicted CXXCH cytochrome family protein